MKKDKRVIESFTIKGEDGRNLDVGISEKGTIHFNEYKISDEYVDRSGYKVLTKEEYSEGHKRPNEKKIRFNNNDQSLMSNKSDTEFIEKEINNLDIAKYEVHLKNRVEERVCLKGGKYEKFLEERYGDNLKLKDSEFHKEKHVVQREKSKETEMSM